MSLEEQVRKRHEMEDRLRIFRESLERFRQWASRMDVRSIELAMAKLVDRIDSEANEAKRLDLHFKGVLLNPIYEKVRTAPPKKQGFFASILGDPPPSIAEIVAWNFPYPVPLTETHVSDWARGDSMDATRLLAAPGEAR
ncbi:MAG: hypothetical protein J0M17_01020 [Planctomycetes bacterium]|nr:hypothetical protein [Planctomycetota bacterium]